MKRKYIDFQDDLEHEEIHFRAYCLLKPNIFIHCAKNKLEIEEADSILYPLYLEEKKKYWPHILSVEKSCRGAVDKIIENVVKDEKIRN